jgi:hypothetical protein
LVEADEVGADQRYWEGGTDKRDNLAVEASSTDGDDNISARAPVQPWSPWPCWRISLDSNDFGDGPARVGLRFPSRQRSCGITGH